MALHYSTDGAVATFLIKNGSVNPTTPQMHHEMFLALEEFERDRNVKVGIITGDGTRAFSAGDDLKYSMPPADAEERIYRHFYPYTAPTDPGSWPGWDRKVIEFPRFKPIVAAVHGWCLGQGMQYLLYHSDIRVAGRSAKFGMPEITYGMGGGGGIGRFFKHVPRVDALKMLLTGESIDANEAFRIHLVNEVLEDDEVLARANELAASIARHPLLAIRAEMEAFVRGEDLAKESGLALAHHIFRIQRLAFTEEDIKFSKSVHVPEK